MAVVEARPSRDGRTAYRVKVRLYGYPPQTATFPTKTLAKQWGQATETAIREGRYFTTAEAKKHTLADLIDRYIQTILPLKPKSVAKQKPQLEWWKGRIGSYRLSEITPALIVEQKDFLLQAVHRHGRRYSPSTVVRYLAVLSHAFSVAVREWQWCNDNPAQKLKKPKEPKGRARYLSDEERSKLLPVCAASSCRYLYPVVVVALSTGMRFSEVMQLRWSTVDLATGRATLYETKNGDVRVVPLVGAARDELRKLSLERRFDTDLLFPNKKDGDAAEPFCIRKPWNGAVASAALSDFRFHDLRHSAASYLAMSGATVPEIAEVLGHRTLQMVKRYSHLSESHTRSVVERMNAGIF